MLPPPSRAVRPHRFACVTGVVNMAGPPCDRNQTIRPMLPPPSFAKIYSRGQKSSICESGKDDEGGWLCEAPHLPRSVFSKSSFPKLAPHISTIFVHGEPILKKKSFLTVVSKYLLLDVRRFSRQAVEGEKTGENRTSLTRCYRDALVRVPAMRAQAAEKAAHIK